MEINQILPALSYRDAVSNDTIMIQRFLRENGYNSRIFAKHIHPDVSEHATELSRYSGSSDTIVIYHFSLAGDDVTDFVKSLPDKKIMIYHNITPPEFFTRYDDGLYLQCEKGLLELRDLHDEFLLAIGDSEYNRLCLEEAGYTNTTVLPLLLDFESIHGDINVTRSYNPSSPINILFVGRVSPNKKFEDIIKTFYYYHSINPRSTLYLVGNQQIPRYHSELEELIERLDLCGAVVFTGTVSESQLREYYRMSHIFLCMSEHEGFCVPLLEAMYYKIPVIAYDSTGVTGTLGGAGILVTKKNYLEIAELINILVEDEHLREKIILKQNKRLAYFDTHKVGSRLLGIIQEIDDYTKTI
jgi:glycosyltransferase involved in cell wall biosynthesis